MAESISERTLKSWSKQVGDTVATDEEIVAIETDSLSSLTCSQNDQCQTRPARSLLPGPLAGCSSICRLSYHRQARRYPRAD
ncbi:uncharacterized protein LACBIDRAFT_300335 [Laccaria bicolor S238N-H82]|uniref:Predicted protein n=1 Tax=Laccaria bicolor (strain S238N-H82 / ATCC MYA-4686) TaxID=486041 RepID=B0DGI8_LACBS|nr:uncharacterized protein LACBIDRAFT_300335 [Laccaria bicolor S238N-H82]EDR06277.1 predicted protein [Laccaria bicolor S238N-H82]|eukprot:XP_001883138.1 predicted protein [Laccaria bicolor S238N-H82]